MDLSFLYTSFPGGSDGKESAMQETWVWSLGREDPHGVGSGNPLQYSCLENTDKGSWWATVHRGRKELDTTEQLTLSPLLIYINFHIVFRAIYFIIFINFIKEKNKNFYCRMLWSEPEVKIRLRSSKKLLLRGFPGGPLAKTPRPNTGGPSSCRNQIPHATTKTRHSQINL